MIAILEILTLLNKKTHQLLADGSFITFYKSKVLLNSLTSQRVGD
jgi:hypothetical protein